MWADQRSTLTTVEYDFDDARQAARRRSIDSMSSRGITRTKSFSVNVEDVADLMQAQPSEAMGRKGSGGIVRSSSFHIGLEDIGGLLASMPKAKQKQRMGSIGSVVSI